MQKLTIESFNGGDGGEMGGALLPCCQLGALGLELCQCKSFSDVERIESNLAHVRDVCRLWSRQANRNQHHCRRLHTHCCVDQPDL